MARLPAHRLAALSGIAFVVLSSVFPFVAGVFPTIRADAAEVASYYAAHRTGFLWGNYLALVAGPFSLLLLAHLSWRIRAHESGWWWLATLSGGLIAHAIGGVDLLLFQAAALLDVPGAEAIGRALHDTACTGFVFFLIVLAGAQIVTGAALRATGAYGRALADTSIVGGLLSLGGSLGAVWPDGALAPGGPATVVPFGLFILWSLWLSVAVWREPPSVELTRSPELTP
jgi:hypothetical protein